MLVTYEGYNPLEKIPMKDQVEEVKLKVREFDNKFVDLLKSEIEKILNWIEQAKSENYVNKLNLKSIMRIYQELNGIKVINETKNLNHIEKILKFTPT